MELTVGPEQGGEPVSTDPNNIRRNVLIIGEYKAGSNACFTQACRGVPGTKNFNRVGTNPLMI